MQTDSDLGRNRAKLQELQMKKIFHERVIQNLQEKYDDVTVHLREIETTGSLYDGVVDVDPQFIVGIDRQKALYQNYQSRMLREINRHTTKILYCINGISIVQQLLLTCTEEMPTKVEIMGE